MLRSPAMDALRAKYGKYLPHQRSNVDQVPLPFVNDMKKRSGIRVRVVSENGYRSSATRTEWRWPGPSSEVGVQQFQSGHISAPTSDMGPQA